MAEMVYNRHNNILNVNRWSYWRDNQQYQEWTRVWSGRSIKSIIILVMIRKIYHIYHYPYDDQEDQSYLSLSLWWSGKSIISIIILMIILILAIFSTTSFRCTFASTNQETSQVAYPYSYPFSLSNYISWKVKTLYLYSWKC